MGDAEVARCTAVFAELYDQTRDYFGSSPPAVKNAYGMPTLFWSKYTPTELLFKLVVKAAQRAFTECEDEEDTQVILVDRGGRPLWPLVVAVWTMHHARYGSRDALTGLHMAFTGDSRYLKPTLLAHKQHGAPFFGEEPLTTDPSDWSLALALESNATVQMWGSNKWLQGHRGSYLVPSIVDAKDGVVKFSRRLMALGLVDCDDAQLVRLADLKRVVPEGAAFIKTNRLLKAEHIHL